MFTKRDIKIKVIEALNEVLPEKLSENAPDSINIYEDLHLDSIDLVSVFMLLEEEYDINIEERLSAIRNSHSNAEMDDPMTSVARLGDIVSLFYEFQ